MLYTSSDVLTGGTTSADPETTLEALFALATQVLNEHVNDHDLCAVCGSAFPCERAVLADHNLALSGAS